MDIVKKTGLERIVKRHHASTDKIQPIVDELVKEGLTIGTDELRDLSDKCAPALQGSGKYGKERILPYQDRIQER